MRPCIKKHLGISPTCNICRLFQTSDFHNRLWGGHGINSPSKTVNRAGISERLTPDIEIRVSKAGCHRGCQWRWVVFERGVPTESGECPTKQEAYEKAWVEARELARSQVL